MSTPKLGPKISEPPVIGPSTATANGGKTLSQPGNVSNSLGKPARINSSAFQNLAKARARRITVDRFPKGLSSRPKGTLSQPNGIGMSNNPAILRRQEQLAAKSAANRDAKARQQANRGAVRSQPKGIGLGGRGNLSQPGGILTKGSSAFAAKQRAQADFLKKKAATVRKSDINKKAVNARRTQPIKPTYR